MDFNIILSIIYVLLIIATAVVIIYETDSNTKALGYLLAVLFLPVIGIIVYFSVGQNYRKRKLYHKKLLDSYRSHEVIQRLMAYSNETSIQHSDTIGHFNGVSQLILKDEVDILWPNNKVDVLINGERKFPRVLEDLRNAQRHIHLEYYIFADDTIGRQIEDILIEKAQQGVSVRFIYDDFGSHALGKRMAHHLREHGVEVSPFYKIKFYAFANRINYRNHRKIIVIDGRISYVGGINVSDYYINKTTSPDALYWRDTSIRIEGPATVSLQNIFLNDWNFCSGANLVPNKEFFPLKELEQEIGTKVMQIVHSGPDSDRASIMNSLVQIIASSQEELLITNPYFIPDSSIVRILKIAALRGVKIKLLVPDISDSKLVNAAAESNYQELLDLGIEIHRYTKGFVHAKTLVADRRLSVVGTANLDYRSFDLNFEVNGIVYDRELASELARQFEQDLREARKMTLKEWQDRGFFKILKERAARLFSPLL